MVDGAQVAAAHHQQGPAEGGGQVGDAALFRQGGEQAAGPFEEGELVAGVQPQGPAEEVRPVDVDAGPLGGQGRRYRLDQAVGGDLLHRLAAARGPAQQLAVLAEAVRLRHAALHRLHDRHIETGTGQQQGQGGADQGLADAGVGAGHQQGVGYGGSLGLSSAHRSVLHRSPCADRPPERGRGWSGSRPPSCRWPRPERPRTGSRAGCCCGRRRR